MRGNVTEVVSIKLAKMSFISALLVVALHVGIEPKWIGKELTLAEIAVPAFFLMAGYLFAGRMGESGWWLRQVKSRLRSLVIPYVFWNVAYWGFLTVPSVVLGLVGVKYGGIELIEGLMGSKWDVLGLMPLSFSALGLLWFVRCLIVIAAISPLFVVFSRKWGGGADSD